MNRSRKMSMLMLPLLMTYVLQATQYARAPVKYNYYIVQARHADIALVPGTDLAPNGQPLLQNATSQVGLYNLSLGRWGPGYRVNYTDAFNVTNNEAFPIKMIGFNFSGTGGEYLNIYILNNTNPGTDIFGDFQVLVWNGTHALINATNYIYFSPAPVYGQPGGTSRALIMINILETGIGLNETTSEIRYDGTLYFWFSGVY
jgi:hypothetical protein